MPITLLQDAFTRPASTFEMLRLSLVTTLAGRWEDLNLAVRAVQRRGGLTPAQNAQFESSLEDYAQAHGAGAADPTLDIDRDLADIDADVQAILDATEPPRGEPEQEEPLDVIGAALSLLCDILADHVFGFTILRAEEAERIRVLIDEASADLDDDEGDDDADTSEDDESDIVIAGRQVPFVQVGMIVHPDDCLNCERDGNPLWCSALVCDIHDDDETARFGMMATLLFRNGERREEPCDELRRRWRMARDFDQTRVYTGRWGAIPRGSVWPVAEVNEDA